MNELPKVMVQDWAEDLPITTHYFCGDNELNLEIVYHVIKRLSTHPGCGRLEITMNEDTPQQTILHQCSDDFEEDFWICCSFLLDYFADFLAIDSVHMQAIWFHFYDSLHIVAKKLPHWFWNSGFPVCEHSAVFGGHYEKTLELMNRVILGRRSTAADDLIHHNGGLTKRATYFIGGYKAGLKPWQQFLLNGSPGFEPEPKDLVYPEDVRKVGDRLVERHVPMGALALVQRHTARARALAAEHAQTDEVDDEANFMADFDNHALRIGEVNTYTSMTGHQTLAQPMYPNPFCRNAPRRWHDLIDPSQIMDYPTPASLWMLDEAVGSYKGTDPVEHPKGRDQFHMWTVTSGKAGDECDRMDVDSRKGLGKEVLGEMFDDWEVDFMR